MIKKLVAIALVLILVASGLFATFDFTALPTPTATLTATVGDFFYHGFVVSGQSNYNAAITINNAFSSTSPSFTYGYETNYGGPFYIYMSVSDFTNDPTAPTGTVKIKQVVVTGSGGQFNTNYASSYDTTDGYRIFAAPSNTYTKNSAVIQVVPFLLENEVTVGTTTDIKGTAVVVANTAEKAAPGEYEATIQFSVKGS